MNLGHGYMYSNFTCSQVVSALHIRISYRSGNNVYTVVQIAIAVSGIPYHIITGNYYYLDGPLNPLVT